MTKTFRDLGVDPALCDALAESGITHPFPIQELTLPLALEGHDLIGQARTGTGKTLAFGLPLLQRLDPSSGRTQALVIVPTRELCLQVYSDLQIGAAKGLTSISVYGGVGYDEQIDALSAGAHVVVGTPGRLLDLLNRGVLDLSAVSQLVLDEADEMLDMGFLPDVERLVEACQGANRHTMLFSATMPTAIVKLARRYMDHPTFTRADHEQKNTAPLVTQYFFEVHRMDKPRLLARILQSKDRGGVYVFVRTKHMADRLVNDLEELRVPSIAIHGDLRQTTREKNLDRFRSGQATVLVCTEVAARGLDVSGVTHVINYDCPDDEKMYLHRIGRTARAGEAGVAITFAEFNEIDRLNVIRKAVGATESEVQQVFSTSKQLAEMFDLPDVRPWDHLTTKSGSDEARAKRESRSDGKPKSPRSQEGRGGDHDARRPERRDRPEGRDRPDRSDRSSRSDRASRRTSRSDETTSAAQPEGRSSSREADRPRDAAARADRTAAPAAPDSGAEDSGAKSSRSRSSRTKGSRTQSSRTQSSRTETSAAKNPDAPSSRADTSGAKKAGSKASDASGPDDGTRDAVPTTRTRTRTRARSAASESGETRSRTRTPDAPDATAAADSRNRSPRKRSGGASKTEDAADVASPTPAKRQRARGARSETRSEERGTEISSDTKRGGSRGGRTSPRSGGRSGGRKNGGRGGGSPEPDSTVRVAPRGEDARGEGQPQVARRVKVEHLP